jgi:hypothetical protein
MKLTHYNKTGILFSVFFLLIFSFEAVAVEKQRANSKSSSLSAQKALSKKKVDAKKKKALTAQQLLAKKKAEAQKATALKKQQAAAKKKALSNQRALTKKKVDAQKQKALSNQRALTKRKVDAQKQKALSNQRALTKRKADAQKQKVLANQRALTKKKLDAEKQKALANQQSLGEIKANSKKRKLFPSKLSKGKIDKRQTLSGNKKPIQALKQRTRRPTVGKEEVSGVSKVVVIPGGGMMSGGGSGLSDRVKPEDLSNQDMSSGKGKITGMDLGVVGRDSPLIEKDSPLDEAEKMRESLNEVQVIGGLDGRNDAQDGGGATTPGAALPEGVGDPTGMVGDETTTGSGGVKIGSSKGDGVKASPTQKAAADTNKFTFWGKAAEKATGTGADSNRGRELGRIMGELDDLGGSGKPMTHDEAMKEIDKIQKNKNLTQEEKEKAMTALAEKIEKDKKKAEDAAGETDPESGGERPETIGTASLDAFTNKYQEDKQKAMAGADIDYGDKIEGTTKELNEDAAKGLPEQVTGQYGEGHQAAGKPTEQDKQRLLDAADQGTKF